MTSENIQLAKTILAEISRAKSLTSTNDVHSLFLSSETIISLLASFIGPMIDEESIFKKKIKDYMLEKDFSNAKATAMAEADDEYKNWKKMKYTYELAESQIAILKKFKDDLEKEFKRT